MLTTQIPTFPVFKAPTDTSGWIRDLYRTLDAEDFILSVASATASF